MREGHCIERCMHFGVIVEIDKYIPMICAERRADAGGISWSSALRPGANFASPSTERLIGIATHVEFLISVQPNVDEVRGRVFHEGPFSCGISNDEADLVSPQQIDEMSAHEGRMTHLESMAESMDSIVFCPCPTIDAIIVTPRERCRVGACTREKLEKGFQPLGIVRQVGRKLPKEWAQLFAKTENSGSEEIRERCFNALQSFEVGDETASFDGENKVRRSGVVPSAIALGSLKRVE